ncbi:MAG TPA: DUF4340 domain-containing protein [Kofleriaceae bacterium]|jgi:hypothetical protein
MLTTRFHKILLAVLAVQVMLALVFHMRSDTRAATKEVPLLVGFDAAKVTHVQVVGEGHTIDLVKTGPTWAIASAFNYPGESTKIGDALAPLAKIAAGDPITTKSDRHKQLGVDKDEPTRKLIITADGKTTTLFVGNAVGSHRVAVRIDGSDNVYAVAGLSASSFGTEPRAWADAQYLSIPREQITSVKVDKGGHTSELVITKPTVEQGSAAVPPPPGAPVYSAVLDGAPVTLAANEAINPAGVDAVLNDVANITLDAPADPKRDASAPVATITVANGTNTVILDVLDAGARYWVRQRGRDQAIELDKARLEAVLGMTREKLVHEQSKDAPPLASPAAPSGMEGFDPSQLPPGVTPEMLMQQLQQQQSAH